MGNDLCKIHLAYKNMIDRCYNKNNAAYVNYGGRGIAVCEQWLHDRESFVSWAFGAGHASDLSLDRINVNGHYEPRNCRWATIKEQLRNQRRNRRLSYNGDEFTIVEWAERLGVQASTLGKRLKYMSVDKALSSASLRSWKHGTRQGYEFHKCRCEECRASNTARGQKLRAARREAA